jgi:hypothetical protein
VSFLETESDMSIALVTPRFVLPYPIPPVVTDYRCAVNGTATQVVFQRNFLPVYDETDSRLFVANLGSGPEPKPLNDLIPANRPSWCWHTGQISFNGLEGLYIQNTVESAPSYVNGTDGMTYTAWSREGDFLVADNCREPLTPGTSAPRATKIEPKGKVLAENMTGDRVWVGMPTLNPQDPTQIAFAGSWRNGHPNRDYNQNLNYVWLLDSEDPSSLRPLEPGVHPRKPFQPAHQARAPWWSPDGKWIVFESARADPMGELYAIFIQDAAGKSPAMQVTDIIWNANHAKWYPDGKQLIVSVVQEPRATARGIARLDVSSFVGA